MRSCNIFCIVSVICLLATVNGVEIEEDGLGQNTTELNENIYISRDNVTDKLQAINSTNEDYFDEYSSLTDIEDELGSSNFGSARLVGATAATVNQFNYAVRIVATTPAGSLSCTGALLTKEYAITAASCIYDASAISVTAATTVSTETADGTTIQIVRAGYPIVYPKYSVSDRDHDIALVKINPSFTLSVYVGVIKLAYKYNTDEHKDVLGKSLRVLSFGQSTANLATFLLQYEYMSVMSKATCFREIKRRSFRPNVFQECLSTEGGSLGMCNDYDKGGIVSYKFDSDSQHTLAGVMNYYYACGSSTPNLFTRVGPYWDWIRTYVSTSDNIG